MKAANIIEILDNLAPRYLIDKWDNTGFQIGDPEMKVEKILIALDLDRRVFKRALDINAQMIITHHPIIFYPLKSINKLSYKESLIYDIIKEDIVVYNAHTNLDMADGGVNDTLAKILGLKNTRSLKSIYEENPYELANKGKIFGYGRIGEIEEIYLDEYLEIIKEKLAINHLIVYGNRDKKVKNIALCGGSGSSFIKEAFSNEVDLYITGDIKYHDAQYGDELGLTIVDAGHFHTEKVILPIIKEYLEKNIENIEIEIYGESSPPYTIV